MVRFWRRIVMVMLALVVVGGMWSGVGAQGGDGAGGDGVTLPDADWWALVYLPSTDTLHWLNPNGQQLVLPRPQLPGEANFGFPEMHVGANGRMLVVAMPINGGAAYGLGFYDFSTGELVRTHETQLGEVPRVYSRYASDVNSLSVAVGFAYGLSSAQQGWRVILFDLFTGDVVSQLTSDSDSVLAYAEARSLPSGPVSPQPIWFEGGAGVDAGIHIRLDPIGVSDDLNVPDSAAVVWYPNGRPGADSGALLFPSPYTARAIDFSRLGDSSVFAYFNGALPRTEVPFVDANAIGRGAPDDVLGYPSLEFVFGTGAQAYDRVRWAGDGSQVVFRAIDANETQRWFAVDLNGGQPQALPATTLDVIGLPTGFLYAADGKVTLRSVPSTGAGDRVVWDTGLGDVAMQFIYATQPGTTGTLGMQSVFVPMGGESFVEERDVLQCELGLPTQLQIGDTARLTIAAGVFFTDDPTAANLAETFERLPNGSTLAIVGGPLCVNGFAYWQVELPDGRRGWSAESGETDYVLVNVNRSTTAAGTASTAPAEGGECDRALPQQISRRDTVRTVQDVTFNVGEDPQSIGNPAAAITVPAGQTLFTVGGPLCRDGLRYWVFDWQNAEGIWQRGWVAESTATAYLVAPTDSDTVVVAPEDLPAIGAEHCTGAPASIVTIGTTGVVETVNAVPVLLREQPGGGQVGLVESGQSVVILDGPSCADGFPFTYWRVRVVESGLDGWMAEGDALGYFIDPEGEDPTPIPPTAAPTLAPTTAPTAAPATEAPVEADTGADASGAE